MVYRHLAAILLLALLALPAWADGDGTDLSDEQIETLRSHLEEAYKLDHDGTIVEVLEETKGVGDEKLIKLVAKAFRSKSPAVIEAALKSLGGTDGRAALDELHKLYRRVRNKRLDGYEDLFALLLKEIGRHGNKSSVDILTDKVFKNLTYDVGVARIMGLGNIRDASAVEGLVHLSRQAGGRGAAGVVSAMRGTFRTPLRVAMATLTGTDQGEVPADWDTWYRNHRKNLKIAEDRPQVPDDVSAYWEGYWGVPYYRPGDEPAPPTMRSPIRRIQDPSPEQVKEAVDALKAAFRSRDSDEILVTLEQYGGVLDKRVVHEVAGGMRSRDRAVKLMTIEVLGWMRYDPALKQLHREFRRTKSKWGKDEDMFAELLQAIGRHGDPSSVKVLAESPFKALTLATGRARIFGLGNIRANEAIEQLVRGTQLAGSNPPRSWRPAGDKRFTREFEISLTILTGQEFGRDLEAWRQWWRKNAKTFKVSKARPQIPDWMRKIWEEYWNEPYYAE